MNTKSQTIDVEVEINRGKAGTRGRKKCAENGPSTSVPRISRLMALAIKFQGMVDRREVCDYADLARLGYVTRARITQIMNLLNLAPDIQEDILLATSKGTCERDIRCIVGRPLWHEQRVLWATERSVRSAAERTSAS